MKRILIIENDVFPELCVDTLINTITEEGDEVKEINYAQYNTPAIVEALKTMANLTKDGDEFIIAGSSTFNDEVQLEELLKLIVSLPVIPKLYFELADYHVERMLIGKSWILPNKEIQGMIKKLLDEGHIYSFNTNDRFIDNTIDGKDGKVEERELESLTQLTEEMIKDKYSWKRGENV